MRDAYQAKRRKHINKMFNERVKLLSTSINAIGLAIMVSAFIFPIVREGDFIKLGQVFTWFWGIGGVIIHLLAQSFLGLLKPED